MSTRRLTFAVILAAICVLALSRVQGAPSGVAPARSAAADAEVAPSTAAGSAAPPPIAADDRTSGTKDTRAAGEVRAVREVRASGTKNTRAARAAAAEAQDETARVNRQQLLSRTLADLSSAAERAEREGKPEYAAALRRRAEVLSQSVKAE